MCAQTHSGIRAVYVTSEVCDLRTGMRRCTQVHAGMCRWRVYSGARTRCYATEHYFFKKKPKKIFAGLKMQIDYSRNKILNAKFKLANLTS